MPVWLCWKIGLVSRTSVSLLAASLDEVSSFSFSCIVLIFVFLFNSAELFCRK